MVQSSFEMLWREQERSRDRRVAGVLGDGHRRQPFFLALRQPEHKAPCCYDRVSTMAVLLTAFACGYLQVLTWIAWGVSVSLRRDVFNRRVQLKASLGDRRSTEITMIMNRV